MNVGVELAAEECLGRDALAALQRRRLQELVGQLYGPNAFYTRKLDEAAVRSRERIALE